MTMFSKIKAQLDVSGKTAEFELSELGGDPGPVLILAPAGVDNPEYFNASLRYSASMPKGKKLTEEEQSEAGLQMMLALWPETVIKGWRNSFHFTDSGEEIPYTPELGRDLLETLGAVARDMLIRMLGFAGDMQNFRGGCPLPPVDAEAVSGN